MADRHIAVQPGLDAELEGPEQAADEPHAHFDTSVGLRVVRSRVLLRDGVHALAADAHGLKGLRHERLQCWLVVGFHDELRVAEPRDIIHDEAGHELIFAGALVGDNVREDNLRLQAPERNDHQASLAERDAGRLSGPGLGRWLRLLQPLPFDRLPTRCRQRLPILRR